MLASPELVETLRQLEEELLRPDVRRDRERLERMLAAEFREFGSLGRVFADRDAMIAALEVEPDVELRLADFGVAMLHGGTALVTYRSFRAFPDSQPSESLRSSIWVWRDERWQMVFHQGTRVEREG